MIFQPCGVAVGLLGMLFRQFSSLSSQEGYNPVSVEIRLTSYVFYFQRFFLLMQYIRDIHQRTFNNLGEGIFSLVGYSGVLDPVGIKVRAKTQPNP